MEKRAVRCKQHEDKLSEGLTSALRAYFQGCDVTPRKYTDSDLLSISHLLREADRTTWSNVTRIYTVLRLIGQLKSIDCFIDQGLTDMWFPFNLSQLPHAMEGHCKASFVEMQSLVLTKALHIEKAGVKQHIHFGQEDELPLTIGQRLGQGGYGSVYEARSALSGRAYALKLFKRTRVNQREVQSFMVELQILQRINHHHCVGLVASYTTSKRFGLLMMPIAECNLAQYFDMVLESDRTDKQSTLRTFFGCLAHAVAYLHSSKIRHRDIKPSNILVKGREVYLADFGISLDWKDLTRSTTTADSAKTWKYCAPEVAVNHGRNSSSDVWSLGCVFLEIFTVLKGFSVHDLSDYIDSGRVRYYENFESAMIWNQQLENSGIELDAEIANWVRSMIVIDASSRISAQTLSLTITRHGRVKSGQNITQPFCGRCCSEYDDSDSSSDEALNDDDLWERTFATTTSMSGSRGESTERLVTREVTDLPAAGITKLIPKSDQLSSGSSSSNEESVQVHSDIISDVGMLGTSDGPFPAVVDAEPQDCTGLVDANQSDSTQTRTLPEARIIHASHGSDCDIPLPYSSEKSTNAFHQRNSSQEHVEVSTKNQAHHVKAKEQAVLESSAKIRYKLVTQIIEDREYSFWPSIDLEGHLPILEANAWTTPERLLKAIKADTNFISHFGLIDPFLCDRLQLTTISGIVSVLYFLLRNKLNPNGSSSRDLNNPLACTLNKAWYQRYDTRAVAALLVGFGADLGKGSDESENLLAIACATGNYEMARTLIRLEPRILNRRGRNGLSPISEAVQNGHLSIVNLLLDCGADFRVYENSASPGSRAASQGFMEIIKLLIEAGFGVDECVDDVETESLRNFLFNACKTVLTPSRSRSQSSERMLVCAVAGGHVETVLYLLSKGANPYYAEDREPGQNGQVIPQIIAEGRRKWEADRRLSRLRGSKGVIGVYVDRALRSS